LIDLPQELKMHSKEKLAERIIRKEDIHHNHMGGEMPREDFDKLPKSEKDDYKEFFGVEPPNQTPEERQADFRRTINFVMSFLQRCTDRFPAPFYRYGGYSQLELFRIFLESTEQYADAMNCHIIQGAVDTAKSQTNADAFIEVAGRLQKKLEEQRLAKEWTPEDTLAQKKWLMKTGMDEEKAESEAEFNRDIEQQAEEDEQNHTPAALQQWLLAEIQAAKQGRSSEAHLLRLESDEALVKIVTMHAAKGLQYPLVYCPFVWDAPSGKPDSWQILHRQNQSEWLAKSQLEEADLQQLAEEEASERLRLLYVALTRAEEQLTLYAAHCDNTAANTFAYLLEGGCDSRFADTAAAYAAEKKANKAEGEKAMLRRNWQRFIGQAPENSDFVFTAEAPPEIARAPAADFSDGHYQAAAMPARSFEFIRHTSFTGLSRHVHTRDDAREELQPAIDPKSPIFSGTR